jgi:hypothetical protein
MTVGQAAEAVGVKAPRRRRKGDLEAPASSATEPADVMP